MNLYFEILRIDQISSRYIEFIEHSVELNDLASFPQLTERSKSIGYSVSKVVFRGYLAHDKLQKLHDGAIEVRTKLKIAVSHFTDVQFCEN